MSHERVDEEAVITSLDYQGRGVTRLNGKAVFVDGALPGERVRVAFTRDKARFAEARTTEILYAAASRVSPRCAYYPTCGGCSLQHADSVWQVEAKQQLWLSQLQHIGGGVRPRVILPALSAEPWHYRSRARVSVAYTGNGILLGFKQRQSHRIVAVEACTVLDQRIATAFPAIRDLLLVLSPLRVEEVSLNAADDAVGIGLVTRQWHDGATRRVDEWLADQPPSWQVWRHGHGRRPWL